MITNPTYKGFEIAERCTVASTLTTPAQTRFFVELGNSKAEGFNPEGYATLNNAKGAITKRINADEAAATLEKQRAVLSRGTKRAKAATSDDTNRATVRTGVFDDYQGPDNPQAAPAVQGLAVANDGRTEVLPVHQPIRSRARREGQYMGKLDGRHQHNYWAPEREKSRTSATTSHYMPSRRARKAVKMEVRNSTRQGAFGGHINPKH